MSAALDMYILGPLKKIKKEGFFEKLVTIFDEDSRRIYAEISEAVAAGESSKLEEAAHSLKSASSTIGATAVSSLAHELELLGAGGTTSGASEVLKQLENELTQARDALKSLL